MIEHILNKRILAPCFCLSLMLLASNANAGPLDIHVENENFSNPFFYAVYFSNAAVEIASVELKDNGVLNSFVGMTLQTGGTTGEYWSYSGASALVPALDLRLTSINNEVLTLSGIVTSISGPMTFDSGINFTAPNPPSVPEPGIAVLLIAGMLGLTRVRHCADSVQVDCMRGVVRWSFDSTLTRLVRSRLLSTAGTCIRNCFERPN